MPILRSIRQFLRTYLLYLRTAILTGILVWVPVFVTLWLTWWLISSLGFGIENLIARLVRRLNIIGGMYPSLHFLTEIQYRFGLGFLLAMLLFLSTGFFMRYWLVQQVIARTERFLEHIPFIRPIYSAARQIRDVFLLRQGKVIHSVVLVEFPRPGCYSIGFQTSEPTPIFEKETGKKLCAVFLPTTPNPTSGYLLLLAETDIQPLSLSVEDATKIIVSGGAWQPQKLLPPEVLSPPHPDLPGT